MKFTIQRDLLISSLQNVMKAISPRTVIPILTGIKVEASHNGITLTGSNSDISIESFIPAEEEDKVNVEHIEEGSIVLHAKYFPEIIRKLPEDIVSIEVDSSLKTVIRSGKAEFNLNGQDAEEYPLLPKIQTDDTFEMPVNVLKNMIKQTVFAVSTMETRPILTGVNMRLANNRLHFVATDSHRLASREVEIQDAAVQFENVVVPGKSLQELNKILSDTDELIQISVTNNQIFFRTKNIQLPVPAFGWELSGNRSPNSDPKQNKNQDENEGIAAYNRPGLSLGKG